MKWYQKIFHVHDWVEERLIQMEGYPKGFGPRWYEPKTTYFLSICRCKDCGEPRSFKLD